jgi:quinol monooxygenase YgiN
MTEETTQDDVTRLRALAAALDAREDHALAVITHVDVLPRHTAEAAALLGQYARHALAASAQRCDVLQELTRPNHFTLVEVWATRHAFESHLATAPTRQFRERLHPLLGSPFDARLHRAPA